MCPIAVPRVSMCDAAACFAVGQFDPWKRFKFYRVELFLLQQLVLHFLATAAGFK